MPHASWLSKASRIQRFVRRQPRRLVVRFTWLSLVVLTSGCLRSEPREVVVYTALDREFSEPIFADFMRQTGIRVRTKYDTEASKTVGLANLILSESARPRCDLFWNNEILNTLRLKRAGLLAAYEPPVAASYPSNYRAADGTWHGFAARARVLLVNTQRLDKSDWPTSIRDLTADRFRHDVGLAKPLFGTTATHAACLYTVWGPAETERFFRELQADARILAGNRQVAEAVGTGQLSFGLTDTDDAVIEIERGRPVQIVYPDQATEQMGTLFIPNTLGLIRGSPHGALAEQLVAYLLSPAVETQLAAGQSAQIPLNSQVSVPTRVETPRSVRAMSVDFQAAADHWDAAAQMLRGLGF